MKTVTRLVKADEFVKILYGGNTCYGGDQAWYPTRVGKVSGCAPVAAANIFAYFALSNPTAAKLYKYDLPSINQSDYLKHMNEVIKYVKPIKIPFADIPAGGMPFLSCFAGGVNEFAGSRGVTLEAFASGRSMPLEAVVNLIKDGLKNDSPVALLNMWNNRLKEVQWTDPGGTTSVQDFRLHWVTITSITENQNSGEASVEVSSWGGKAVLDFSDVWENRSPVDILFPAGVIFFRIKN